MGYFRNIHFRNIYYFIIFILFGERCVNSEHPTSPKLIGFHSWNGFNWSNNTLNMNKTLEAHSGVSLPMVHSHVGLENEPLTIKLLCLCFSPNQSWTNMFLGQNCQHWFEMNDLIQYDFPPCRNFEACLATPWLCWTRHHQFDTEKIKETSPKQWHSQGEPPITSFRIWSCTWGDFWIVASWMCLLISYFWAPISSNFLLRSGCGDGFNCSSAALWYLSFPRVTRYGQKWLPDMSSDRRFWWDQMDLHNLFIFFCKSSTSDIKQKRQSIISPVWALLSAGVYRDSVLIHTSDHNSKWIRIKSNDENNIRVFWKEWLRWDGHLWVGSNLWAGAPWFLKWIIGSIMRPHCLFALLTISAKIEMQLKNDLAVQGWGKQLEVVDHP